MTRATHHSIQSDDLRQQKVPIVSDLHNHPNKNGKLPVITRGITHKIIGSANDTACTQSRVEPGEAGIIEPFGKMRVRVPLD